VPCQLDLEDPALQEDYRKLRIVHDRIGQIGRLPDSVLYSLAMRHASFPDPPEEVSEPPQEEAEPLSALVKESAE
jgi:hypothetical protein